MAVGHASAIDAGIPCLVALAVDFDFVRWAGTSAVVDDANPTPTAQIHALPTTPLSTLRAFASAACPNQPSTALAVAILIK